MKRALWVAAYAVAMAYLEAAVVVYLRALYYPAGFAFPLVLIPDRMAAIEIGREAATIMMLLSIAWLAGPRPGERFLHFCLVFGVWDIFYYVWLRALAGWPPSLLTWDILFLIPVPWAGPVLAPLLVSLGLVSGAMLLLARRGRGEGARLSAVVWGAGIVGGLLVLAAFTLDHDVVLKGLMPPPFRWGLFGAGMALAAAALVRAARSRP